MSCKSAMYSVMTTPTMVPAGGVVPLGNVVRKFGTSCQLSGNEVLLSERGYYDVCVSVSATLASPGVIVVSLYKDGLLVPGALSSATVDSSSGSINLCIPALVRVLCCNTTSVLTIVLSSDAATINNVGVVVEKV